MASYYRLRITTPAGQLVATNKVFKLTRAVDVLAEITGIVFPYQVIHRALKNEGVWCESWKRSVLDRITDQSHLVAVIVDLGPSGAESDVLLSQPAESAVPEGFVQQDKPCILWGEADWADYKEGRQPVMYCKP